MDKVYWSGSQNYFLISKTDIRRILIFIAASILVHLMLLYLLPSLPVSSNPAESRISQLPVTIRFSQEVAVKPDLSIQSESEKIKPPASIPVESSSSAETSVDQMNPGIKTREVVEHVPITKEPQPNPATKGITLDRNKLLQQGRDSFTEFIKDEELSVDSQSEFLIFNPELHENLLKARKEFEEYDRLHPEELDLTVDDGSSDIGGYREFRRNGNCWLIPADTSFDELDSRIVMIDPNCPKQKHDLLKRLEKWK